MFESTSFARVIKTGFVNFWRNLWLSTAATMVMTTTLVILGVLFLTFALTNYSIKTVQNTVDISVYFKTGVPEQRIREAKTELEADSRVREVTFVSQDQATQIFKSKHQNDPALIAALGVLTENPLEPALHIKTNNLEDYSSITDKMNNSQYKDQIDKINFEDSRDIIDKLSKILKFLITFGGGLIIVLALIAVLVIFNTITLTIYNRKEEVEIMRLVGATNWYIRGPFLLEAFLYSAFSIIITAALLIPVFTRVIPKIALYVNPQVTLFNQNIFNYWYLVLMLFSISIIISMLTTMVAIRKYLRI